MGDRKGLSTLFYAAVVLGFNPTDKLIYFPLRENWEKDYPVPEKYDDGKEDCGLVFTTHQTQFKRSNWGEIKRQFRYLKAETYILDFVGKRMEDYFDCSTERWMSSFEEMKECPLSHVQGHTLFYVLSRRIFQCISLSVYRFLQRDLEGESLKAYWMMGDSVWIGGKNSPYRERMQINQLIWVFFYDKEIEKQVDRHNEKWIEERHGKQMRGMKELYKVTHSRTEDGERYEDTAYLNGPEYKSGELVRYDKMGNLVSRTIWYAEPFYRRREITENRDYSYEDSRIKEVDIQIIEREMVQKYWVEPKWKIEEPSFIKAVKRSYFYREDGTLERTEDTVEERIKGRTAFYQEYSIYSRQEEYAETGGWKHLSEVVSAVETYRRKEKGDGARLIYKKTEHDFYTVREVERKKRTELFYRKGSVRHPKKKESVLNYCEERASIETRDGVTFSHEYRDIDENHVICLTYREQADNLE